MLVDQLTCSPVDKHNIMESIIPKEYALYFEYVATVEQNLLLLELTIFCDIKVPFLKRGIPGHILNLYFDNGVRKCYLGCFFVV